MSPIQSGQELRFVHKNISGSTVLATGNDLSSTARTLVAAIAAHTIYIQKIEVNVITDNAATLTFQDTATTPVVIAGTKVSPGIGPIVFDFGDEGRALTAEKGFTLKNSAAGLAADISWQGYEKATPNTAIIPSQI